jgi:hypothetical protein
MKRRIAALERAGVDVVEVLWQRHVDAEGGDGYRYEYAERRAEPVPV